MGLWPILGGTLHLATWAATAGGHSTVGGACDADPARAVLRAEAEALERLALLRHGERLVRHRDALPGLAAGLLAPEPALADTPWWVVGSTANGEAAVPASVALLGWRGDGPLRWKQSSVGTAAHPDASHATATALLECVERHSVRRVWQATATLAVADALLPSAAGPQLEEELRRSRLRPMAWTVTTDLPVVVALVAVTRIDRQQITFGASARPLGDDIAAVRHALSEAISVRAALANDATAEETLLPRQMAARQEDFIAYLNGLVGAAAPFPDTEPTDLARAVRKRFGVPVVTIPVPADAKWHVARVVVPHPEFLVHRDSQNRYALAPGYIE